MVGEHEHHCQAQEPQQGHRHARGRRRQATAAAAAGRPPGAAEGTADRRAPVWIYEGALLFVTDISCNLLGILHIKDGDWEGQ